MPWWWAIPHPSPLLSLIPLAFTLMTDSLGSGLTVCPLPMCSCEWFSQHSSLTISWFFITSKTFMITVLELPHLWLTHHNPKQLCHGIHESPDLSPLSPNLSIDLTLLFSIYLCLDWGETCILLPTPFFSKPLALFYFLFSPACIMW